MGINDVTGDNIIVGAGSSAYDDNYDRIFKKGKYAVEADDVQRSPASVGNGDKDRAFPRQCDYCTRSGCSLGVLCKRLEANRCKVK